MYKVQIYDIFVFNGVVYKKKKVKKKKSKKKKKKKKKKANYPTYFFSNMIP